MKKQIYRIIFITVLLFFVSGCYTRDMVFPENHSGLKKITHLKTKDNLEYKFTDDSLSSASLEKDGVLIKRKFGGQKFLAYNEIETAEYESMNIPLTLLYIVSLGGIYFLVQKRE